MDNLPILPYKSIGMIFDGQAAQKYKIADKWYLATTTDTSYKIYSLPSMRVKFLSPSFEKPITGLSVNNEDVLFSIDNKLTKMHFSHIKNEIAFDCDISTFFVFDRIVFVCLKNKTVKVLITADFSELTYFYTDFVVEKIIHPVTYINKLILCSRKHMVLMNVNTNDKLYDYKEDNVIGGLLLDDELVAIENSPAVDVIGLGFKSGRIIGLHLKTCEIYFEFSQQSPVNSLAFTFNDKNEAFLITGENTGCVNVWNLNKGVLQTKLGNQFSHEIDYVDTVQYEDQEVLLVGSGKQNVIKMFKYDKEEANRYTMLRKREGAEFPIKSIKTYKECYIAALTENPKGELFKYTVTNDSATAKLSKKFNNKKQNIQTEISRKTDDILDFVISENNTKVDDNNNLMTLHKNSTFPLFWDFENLTIRNVFLELYSSYRADTDKKYAKITEKFRSCTAVDISNCGNYSFIGYDDNYIVKLSTKSGAFNTYFKCDLSKYEEKSIKYLFCDEVNNHLVVSIGNRVLIIDFFSGAVILEKLIEKPFVSLYYDKYNDMLIVEMQGFSLDVYKVSTLTAIRSLKKHTSRITALAFSPFSRKVIACDANRNMIFWDLFLGEHLCVYHLDKTVGTIQIDEERGFVYTVYSGERDIKVWTIKNLNLAIETTVELTFKTRVNKLPSNPKDFYVYQTHKREQVVTLGSDINEQLLAEVTALLERSESALTKRKNLSFSTSTDKWRGLIHVEATHDKNKINDKDLQEERDKDLPFFLDFGDNYLNTINKEITGTLAPKVNKSKRLKPDDDKNELLETSDDPIESMLSKLTEDNQETVFNTLLGYLKELTAYEVSYYTKKNCLYPENTLNLLSFIKHLTESNEDFDFKIAFIKLLLNSSYDVIIEASKENKTILNLLAQIRRELGSKCDRIKNSYMEITGVLEDIIVNN